MGMALHLVRSIRHDMPKIGVRKLHHILRTDYGVEVGRDKLYDAMRAEGLLERTKKKKYKTTYSLHNFRVWPNAVRDLDPTRPNQIWVSDITYIIFGYTFRFLFLVTDAYSKKIVGWHFSDSLKTDDALTALKMALGQRDVQETLIHHSDRGTQYCATKYVAMLQKHGITPSMTEGGDPRENTVAERVNGILKQEFIEIADLTLDNAKRKIGRMIDTYNKRRPHLSLGMLTPEEAHSMSGPLTRLWKARYPARVLENTAQSANFATQTTGTTSV